MMLTTAFLDVVVAFAGASGVELRTLSSRVFNDGKVLPALAARSRTISLRRADMALAWFSDHWPEGALWPSAVPRPASAPAAGASASSVEAAP